jgi:hypothetical protein
MIPDAAIAGRLIIQRMAECRTGGPTRNQNDYVPPHGFTAGRFRAHSTGSFPSRQSQGWPLARSKL